MYTNLKILYVFWFALDIRSPNASVVRAVRRQKLQNKIVDVYLCWMLLWGKNERIWNKWLYFMYALNNGSFKNATNVSDSIQSVSESVVCTVNRCSVCPSLRFRWSEMVVGDVRYQRTYKRMRRNACDWRHSSAHSAQHKLGAMRQYGNTIKRGVRDDRTSRQARTYTHIYTNTARETEQYRTYVWSLANVCDYHY